MSIGCVSYGFGSSGDPSFGYSITAGSVVSTDSYSMCLFVPTGDSTTLSTFQSNVAAFFTGSTTGEVRGYDCNRFPEAMVSGGVYSTTDFTTSGNNPWVAGGLAWSAGPPSFLAICLEVPNYTPWACNSVTLGGVYVPLAAGFPTCSATADASSGISVLTFSDGVSSGDTRTVSIGWGDSSTTNLSVGSGSVGHTYAAPLSTSPYGISVTWSTGESCVASANFFSSGGYSGGAPSGSGSGSGGTSTAPSSWDAGQNRGHNRRNQGINPCQRHRREGTQQRVKTIKNHGQHSKRNHRISPRIAQTIPSRNTRAKRPYHKLASPGAADATNDIPGRDSDAGSEDKPTSA